MEFNNNLFAFRETNQLANSIILEYVKDLLICELTQLLTFFNWNQTIFLHLINLDQTIGLFNLLYLIATLRPGEISLNQTDLCISKCRNWTIWIDCFKSFDVIRVFELNKGFRFSMINMYVFESELSKGYFDMRLIVLLGKRFDGDGSLRHKIYY